MIIEIIILLDCYTFIINKNLTNNCFYHDRIEFDYIFNKLIFFIIFNHNNETRKKNDIYFT